MDTMKIGSKIRQIRVQHNMTQKEVANSCDFTTSLLSKIENNVVLPPIATLQKIANCFGVKMSVLLEDTAEQISASHTKNPMHEVEKFVKTEKGYSLLPLAGDFMQKRFQPMIVYSNKKAKMRNQMLYHKGEEFIFIIKGSMVFMVDHQDYSLREGDSLYFDAAKIHGIKNVPDEVYYIDILSD